ncbi:MAG: zinc ABC transporter substrate-binding protein [Oscillospiraceae bacterium]|nr:zinc ABC transporter substrate-binding protein [Oscillospiraceae bacterium]
MKKFLSILFILTITFSFASCSNSSTTGSKKISVVATIFPYYDFAKHAAGDYADVEMLLTPGSDIHSYEPTPSDIAKIEECDMFIYTGGESDSWVEEILNSIDNLSGKKILKMINYVPKKNEVDADHITGDEIDEHIWTSPVNAENLTGIIGSNLGKLDLKNQVHYEENADNYIKEIDSVHKNIKSFTANLQNNRIVVADRFPLLYFTEAYKLQWECAFPGCSSETEPSLARLSKLQKIIKNENMKSIFKLDQSENRVAETLSEDTNTKVLTFYSCETISQQDFDNGETYTTLMAKNFTALREALG